MKINQNIYFLNPDGRFMRSRIRLIKRYTKAFGEEIIEVQIKADGFDPEWVKPGRIFFSIEEIVGRVFENLPQKTKD